MVREGKSNLPDLNEKSTANDAWMWHTDVEQYLRDGYSPRVVKTKILCTASQEPGEWLQHLEWTSLKEDFGDDGQLQGLTDIL